MQLDVGNEPTCHSNIYFGECTVPAQQNYLFKPRFDQFHLGLNSVATEFLIRLIMAVVKFQTHIYNTF